jgi:periplasmic divalent cation tolerance protein
LEPDTDFVIVLTTFPFDRDADQFARTLVEEHLAACVNVLPPMRSTYLWQGVLEQAEERQVVMKTRANRVAALERRLRELHPYEVPEFLVLPILEGSRDYLAWISENTS